MKKIWIVALSVLAIACGQSNTKTGANADAAQAGTEQYFGEKITADSAVSINDLSGKMGDQKEMTVKLEGEVEAVCQKKGCWMDLKKADGSTMRVTFKDYGFFMPKDSKGKTAVVDGVAKVEETSIADLQEYAKDAGKSKEEIAAITEPKKELVFEANGVILK